MNGNARISAPYGTRSNSLPTVGSKCNLPARMRDRNLRDWIVDERDPERQQNHANHRCDERSQENGANYKAAHVGQTAFANVDDCEHENGIANKNDPNNSVA